MLLGLQITCGDMDGLVRDTHFYYYHSVQKQNKNPVIQQQMNCEIHYEQIKFVCRSDNCYFQPLCLACQQDHARKHNSNDILTIRKALQMASSNLTRQKEAIDDLLQPFAKRKILAQRIEDQKKQLKKQRDRLVRYIDDFIDQEIATLTRENNNISFTSTEKQLEKELEEKAAEINEILSNYKRKAPILQRAMNFEIDKFMESLGKSRGNLYGTTSFKYYSSINHEIMLSKLELTSQSSTTKPFRKIMNESPLYFLIDPNYSNSSLLFNFNFKKQHIQLYNTIDQQWMTFHSKEIPINEQGCGVQDPATNCYYWIGGIQSRRKSNSFIVFSLDEPDRQKRWRQYRLKTARSSAMATLIKFNDKNGKQRKAILVAGGMGQNGQVLKSCQLIDLETHQVYPFGQTNFAVFSGALAVFNNSTVLRFGGLCKNRNDYSVAEVVEKLDCQEAFLQFERDRKEPRWSYIQLELPKGEYLSKPKLFYANQAAIQINPNEVFIFGGLDAGLKGAAQSYILGMEEFTTHSREVRERNASRQQRFSIRWVNQKPLITGDDFGALKPIIWKQRLYTLQNMGNGEIIGDQKRLLEFDMYQWYETENVLPE